MVATAWRTVRARSRAEATLILLLISLAARVMAAEEILPPDGPIRPLRPHLTRWADSAPFTGHPVRYRLLDLEPEVSYEVRISLPASNPALASFWVASCGEGEQEGDEAAATAADRLGMAGRRPDATASLSPGQGSTAARALLGDERGDGGNALPGREHEGSSDALVAGKCGKGTTSASVLGRRLGRKLLDALRTHVRTDARGHILDSGREIVGWGEAGANEGLEGEGKVEIHADVEAAITTSKGDLCVYLSVTRGALHKRGPSRAPPRLVYDCILEKHLWGVPATSIPVGAAAVLIVLASLLLAPWASRKALPALIGWLAGGRDDEGGPGRRRD